MSSLEMSLKLLPRTYVRTPPCVASWFGVWHSLHSILNGDETNKLSLTSQGTRWVDGNFIISNWKLTDQGKTKKKTTWLFWSRFEGKTSPVSFLSICARTEKKRREKLGRCGFCWVSRNRFPSQWPFARAYHLSWFQLFTALNVNKTSFFSKRKTMDTTSVRWIGCEEIRLWLPYVVKQKEAAPFDAEETKANKWRW